MPEKAIYFSKFPLSLSGSLNKENCQIWGTERPQQIYHVSKGESLVMICDDVSQKGIIYFYSFDNLSVTVESYKSMLR